MYQITGDLSELEELLHNRIVFKTRKKSSFIQTQDVKFKWRLHYYIHLLWVMLVYLQGCNAYDEEDLVCVCTALQLIIPL